MKQQVQNAADDQRHGDGEDPRQDDALGSDPFHRLQSVGEAHADDTAGDGVRRADRDAEERSGYQGGGTGKFSREASDRRNFRQAAAHGLDDVFSADQDAERHDDITDDSQRIRDMEGLAAVVEVADEGLHLGADTLRGEHAGHQHGDDAHGLGRVVGAVADAEGRRREMLQHLEDFVDTLARLVLAYLQKDAFKEEAQEQADERGEDDEGQGDEDGRHVEHRAAVDKPCRSDDAADKGMRGGDGHAAFGADSDPNGRSYEGGEDQIRVDDVLVGEVGHGVTHGELLVEDQSDENEGHELPKRSPEDGLHGRHHLGGDDGRDGVGRVVHAVQEGEDEGKDDGQDDGYGQEVHHDSLIKRLFTVLVTSLARSVVSSTTCAISLYFSNSISSFSFSKR